MRKFQLLFFLFLSYQSGAQIIANLQLQPIGIVHKPQLWSMFLVNTSGANMNIHVELNLYTVAQNTPVLSAVTKTITIAPGTTHLNASLLSPIQYTSSGSSYNVDINPNGLIPIGNFNACFTYFRHVTDYVVELAEQCQEISVEPLGPPQLLYPFDATAIEDFRPIFNWLPPIPMHLFSNLRYDFVLVPMSPNQSPEDAVQLNIPIYSQQNVLAPFLPYPLSAPALELNKRYAWRVSVKNAEAPVGNTESWQFYIKQFGRGDVTKSLDQPFAKLKKEEEGYALFSGALKFEYLNETSDTAWNCTLFHLDGNKQTKVDFSLAGFKLQRGFNQVKYPVTPATGLLDKNIYLLEVTNSRKEKWKLRFEYRTPTEITPN